jgi:SAM-dependent methyltransferase
MDSKDNINMYYNDRSSEYDQVYLKPERQADLRKLEYLLEHEFKGLNVLEIACGTGYWTQFMARSARGILATDYNNQPIKIAQTRNFSKCSMEFVEADAYLLNNIREDFSGGFCGFWWSHIPKQKRQEFLKVFHSHLASGAKVIMLDNRYVEGSSTPILRRDDQGNTYQLRKLKDGSIYEIMKNFPPGQEIKNDLNKFCKHFQMTLLDYYWFISYTIS